MFNLKALVSPFGILAMMLEPTVAGPPTADNLLQYAVTQGGLFGVVLIGGYFYRRDMLRIADQRMERIEVLTNLVATAATASANAAASLRESQEAVRAQASSIERLSSIIQRLDVTIGNRRVADATT